MSAIKTHSDWKNPKANLVGVDGNAFAIIGYTQRMLRQSGNSKEVIDAYIEEAQSDDYDHLLQTSMAYCGMFEIGDLDDYDESEWERDNDI